MEELGYWSLAPLAEIATICVTPDRRLSRARPIWPMLRLDEILDSQLRLR